MEWGDIASNVSQPVTWTAVIVFALTTFRWLLTRGDELQREAITELRRQRDEFKKDRDEQRDRARKAEKLVRAYHRKHGPLPDNVISGSISLADLMEHIREHNDEAG